MVAFKATKKTVGESAIQGAKEALKYSKEVNKVADEKKDFQMSQLEGIRRGQAFNLAVQAAIEAGTPTDKKEIFSLFTFYYELAKLSQTYSMEEIKGIIE